MSRVKLAYVGAAAATITIHVVAFGGLNAMKKPEPEKHMTTVMVTAPKPKPKAKPPEPPKPIEAPKELLQHPTVQRAAPPKPAAAPPPDPVAAAHPALAAMPDFGINLSGGLGGPGGIAVPMGGGPTPASVQPKAKEKVLGVAAERPAVAGDDCAEDLVKAKPQGFVKPTYTDDARAAGIEGRVRVEVSLDETGHVLGARVVSGLGHGLDESAIDAAKRMAFSSATRCGKSVKSTFVVSMRFVLGE
ncbi:MAG: energy transducer TonB [Pseudomonadota bacterium]